MTPSIEKIRAELEEMGHSPVIFDSPQGVVIAFRYRMESGSHAGESVMVGVSGPDGDYPEYPPHWIHISPPIDDKRGGTLFEYTGPDGNKWLAMSRPPVGLWDDLRIKNMSQYIANHVRRIWKDV